MDSAAHSYAHSDTVPHSFAHSDTAPDSHAYLDGASHSHAYLDGASHSHAYLDGASHSHAHPDTHANPSRPHRAAGGVRCQPSLRARATAGRTISAISAVSSLPATPARLTQPTLPSSPARRPRTGLRSIGAGIRQPLIEVHRCGRAVPGSCACGPRACRRCGPGAPQ